MPALTQEERELRRALIKELLAQGIDPGTIDEAGTMSIEPGGLSSIDEPLSLMSEFAVGVGEAEIEGRPPHWEEREEGEEGEEGPLMSMGGPGMSAMADISATQEQAAALPPPMTEQEGMAPSPLEATAPEAPPLPPPEELPDIPAEDPVDEELAQRAGQIATEQGGALRAANQGIAGALRGSLGGLLAEGAKDPAKAQQAQEMMAGAGELTEERDVAREELDEERQTLQIARTAPIEARSRAATEESLRLQDDVDQRERFEAEAKTKSA